MAGGVGERFWPLSSPRRPKQLLDLTGEGSMIQLTVERSAAFSSAEEIVIITNALQLEAVRAEVPQIPTQNMIAEPIGRNTAPCICVASKLLHDRFGNEPVLVLPADHLIGDRQKYEAAVGLGKEYVDKHDVLLTFGIEPSRPETGYGYLKTGKKLFGSDSGEIFESQGFFEKPSVGRAEQYYKDGGYCWNSGMFIWKTGTILDALQKYQSDTYEAVKGLTYGMDDFDKALEKAYQFVSSESIDFGVMEKADNVAVLRGKFDWNDVGSWESVRDLHSMDGDGNVTVGDHILIDSTCNTVYSANKTVGMIGVENIVVVDGGDALLVCSRDRVQDVRKIAERIKTNRKNSME